MLDWDRYSALPSGLIVRDSVVGPLGFGRKDVAGDGVSELTLFDASDLGLDLRLHTVTHTVDGSIPANPWSAHFQNVWKARAVEVSALHTVPSWLRVAFLAFGFHHRNGHAEFNPGEIQRLLNLNASQVSKAIRRAKDTGYLDEQSEPRCLVVPPTAVFLGGIGHPNDPCHTHGRQKPERT